MPNKVFNSNSIYQLFQYLLLTSSDERKYFIVGNAFPKEIYKNIKEKSIFVGNDMLSFQNKNRLIYMLIYIKGLIKLKRKYKTDLFIIKDMEIYGASVFAPLLSKKNKIYLLEDGTGNYKKKDETYYTLKHHLLNFLHIIFLGVPATFFVERKSYVQKIFLTGISKIPNDLLTKTQIINLKELWENKSILEKNEIFKIFNIDSKIIEKYNQRKIFLFTQPLSEDKLLQSEEKKIDIYRKCLINYNYSDVIVKNHPRDTTNYEMYFDGVIQVKEKLPYQVLEILGLKINTAITLFSTAVLSISSDVNIIWYGTTLSNELYDKFGVIPIEKFKK